MTMAPDRLIMLAPNHRTTCFGVDEISEALFRAYQRDADVLDYTVDFTSILGSDTIASVDYDTQGASAVTDDAFTAAGVVTFNVGGTGHVDVKITTTGDKVKQLRLLIEPRTENIVSALRDYDDC